jgi:hypothetical protein
MSDKGGRFPALEQPEVRVQEIGGLFDNALVYLQSISNGKLESLRLPRIGVLESPRSKVHEWPVYQMLWPPISGFIPVTAAFLFTYPVHIWISTRPDIQSRYLHFGMLSEGKAHAGGSHANLDKNDPICERLPELKHVLNNHRR